MVIVSAKSLPRDHGEAIDRINEPLNSIDQSKGRGSRLILRGHDSEEQEIIFPELWTLDWQIPKGELDDDRVYGITTHRRPRDYGRIHNEDLFRHPYNPTSLRSNPHGPYDRRIGQHAGGSAYGHHDRPINPHSGSYGNGGRYEPHHNTHATQSRYDRKY